MAGEDLAVAKAAVLSAHRPHTRTMDLKVLNEELKVVPMAWTATLEASRHIHLYSWEQVQEMEEEGKA
jgi:dTDP-4-dehydrorhamnose reductase